jgi:myo-inositol 2-dehydrogenase/D-chiro-inositol 1-dehydrogenase
MTDTTVRYGIIGSGMMGLEHMLNLAHVDGARVVAIADPHDGSRDLAVQVHGDDDLELFADHRDLLAAELCDAVVVATPNHTHVDVMADVLAVDDLHVLVEKPLCTTVADCRRLASAAEGRAGLVWVGLEYRYMPPVARLVREVKQGAIGEVRMLAIREHRFPFLRKVGDWNRFNKNTGGTLVEKCCHFFDLMNLVIDDQPIRVSGSGGQDVNHLDERYDGEMPDILDNAFVIVDYAGGARALLDLCMFAEASQEQEEISVVGDLGKAEAFLPSAEFRLGRRDRGRPGVQREVVTDPRVAYEGFHHGSSYLEHLDFLAAVRSGGTAGVGVEEGTLAVAMGVAAQQSIAEGRVVELDEVLAPGAAG